MKLYQKISSLLEAQNNCLANMGGNGKETRAYEVAATWERHHSAELADLVLRHGPSGAGLVSTPS